MTVKDGAHAIAIDRFFEPGRSEEGDDLGRLALNGRLNWRVVQNGDPLRRSKSRQCRLELERLFDCLVHEFLDDLLAPRAERAASETAAEAFHPGEADTIDLRGIAVKHCHARVGEDLHDLALFAGFEIV